MYQFTGKLKSAALVMMLLGAIGLAVGFFSNNTHKTTHEEVEAMVETADHHETEATHEVATHDEHAATEDSHHAEIQAANRPWAAAYVPMLFFFMVALTIFVFYTSQVAASAGWSVAVYRVMQGMSGAILPIGVILFVFLLLSAMGMNHLFPWMHAEGDEVVAAKSFWLNIPGWLIRAFLYLAVYIGLRHLIIKKSVEQDNADPGDYSAHKKLFKMTIIFVAFFMLSEAALSWDWVMSLDPHWFSTLFAWYIFASAIVSAVTVIALVTMYLKSKGYLDFVNQSHLHDLAKFMFGFSIFWTYLWFAQFMLIWYAHMPEETVYFVPRMKGAYQFIFFFMLLLNFLFPLLVLMDRDWKRKNFIIWIVGVVVLIGHFIDFYQMVMPSAVGNHLYFGVPEIGGVLFFLGLFIYAGFTSLSKRELLHKGSPYIEETLHHHS